jgi:hypothetical protein
MSYARQMLETYPRDLNVDPGVLAATIDALNDCTQACAADADADLSEPNVAELVTCIRLCLECTDVCGATVGVVSRSWRPAWPPARAAATSASGMPGCTSTAECAPRPAGAASGPAVSSWPP